MIETNDQWKYLAATDKIISATNFNREQIRLIVLALDTAHTVADLGVGLGNLAEALLEKGKKVYGIDRDPVALAYSDKKVEGQRKFYPLIANAYNLPVAEASLDGVACLSNLGDFHDIATLLNQVHRVVRPGGIFAVTGATERFSNEMTGELNQLAASGKFVLSVEELEIMAAQYKEKGERKIEDRPKRTTTALLDQGFQIVVDKRFYNNTAYLVVAQK